MQITCNSLLLSGLALSFIASGIPHLIETGYSQSVFKWIIRPYSLVTGLFPYSVAEFVVVGFVVYALYKCTRGVTLLAKNRLRFIDACKKTIPRLARFVLIVYVVFNMLWGLNYNRLPLAELFGLPVTTASAEELAELAMHVTQRANELRKLVDENDRGVMILSNGIGDMLDRAHLGYLGAADRYPELKGSFGRPKRTLFSRYWSSLGISGFYFPFTAEANVNIDIPHFRLPSVTTHEMAHQRGFAREDEAEYIAYVTTVLHPDPDFQYSGVTLALIHAMNALYRYNIDAYNEIKSLLSEGVERDIEDWREYRSQFAGPVQRVSGIVNDIHLKLNRQQDGVQSYGRMVDLLMAEYRSDAYDTYYK